MIAAIVKMFFNFIFLKIRLLKLRLTESYPSVNN